MGLPLIAAQANPAEPGAAAPALGYQSAFTDYKPWGDIRPTDWRAVNDTVRDAKPSMGHGSHGTSPSISPAAAARSQQVPAPVHAAPAQQAPSGQHGHAGHGEHQ